jgi:hypothetical protein
MRTIAESLRWLAESEQTPETRTPEPDKPLFNPLRFSSARVKTHRPAPVAQPVKAAAQSTQTRSAQIARAGQNPTTCKPSLVAVAQALRLIAPALTGVRLLDMMGVNHSGRSYLRYVNCVEGRAWEARSQNERAAAEWVAAQVLHAAGL